jgi:hypothetical protein
VRYIEEVVVKYTQGRACVLIWDVYKSHMTDEVMQTEATMLLDIMHVKAAADPRRMHVFAILSVVMCDHLCVE